MAYVFIENLRQGMDRRSSVDNAPVGSLWDLKNAHINRGGEVEIRKKFVSKYTLPTAETFGLQETATVLYVFGSVASSAVPSGITYQQLEHPDGLVMTELLDSDVFDGKAYAVAKYSDGSIHHFYDGERVTDWDNGIVTAIMSDNNGIAAHLALVIDDDAYTVSVVTDTVTIQAAVAGTGFTIDSDTTNVEGGTDDQTITVVETQSNVPAIAETLASCSLQVVASKLSAGVNKVTSITIDGVDVLGAAVDASDNPGVTASAIATQINTYTSTPNYTAVSDSTTVLITAAEDTGDGPNFFDVIANAAGELALSTGGFGISTGSEEPAQGTVTLTGGAAGSVDSITVNGVDVLGAVVPFNSTLDQTAADVATQINTYSSSPEYTAEAVGSVITISALPSAGSGPNGFVVVSNTTTITTTDVNMAGGATNAVTSVKVDGIEILGSQITWGTDNSTTAAAIAAQINTYNSSPEYIATTAGPFVHISKSSVSDEPTPLALVVSVVGDVTTSDETDILSTVTDVTGGVDAVAGQAQINTAQVGGTFEVGDRFTIILDSNRYGAQFMPAEKATEVLTHDTKVYSLAGSLLQYSGVDAPAQWNTEEDIGAGFINMSNHAAGSEQLTAIQSYQDSLAIFSRKVIQIWFVDADDAINTRQKLLKNVGTRSAKSVIAFGDSDVFFLGIQGIQSLRARDSSNAAYVEDVGTSIDDYLRDYLAGLTDAQIEAAVGLIEPTDGGYWLAVGDRIFVFSYFPASKISAWSYYEPGFSITDMVDFDGRVYVRSDDTVYLYGGDDNATYHVDDEIECVVHFPFFHAGQPADYKQFTGIDASLVNEWDLDMLVDPENLTRYSRVGEIEGFTYNKPNTAGVGHVTHFAPKFTCSKGGYAKLANVSIHYTGAERETEG